MPTHHTRVHDQAEADEIQSAPAPAGGQPRLRDRPVAERIASIVAELVNTRNFCGDERSALRDFEADNGKFTPAERQQVQRELAASWRADQAAAGVTKPIGSAERVRINRALADDDGREET